MAVLPSPVLPASARRAKKRRRLIAAALLLLVATTVGYVAWEKLFRQSPQEFRAPEDSFKYGSIGAEEQGGIPYWIWVVLPRVFPEYLPGPGGYASLGIVWEEGQEVPVGFSKRRIGFERIAINCALCHTATYRETPESKTKVVVAGPANRLDAQGYLRFLNRCAQDPRFNAETLLKSIRYNIQLSWLDEQLYRYVLIPGTRKALLDQANQSGWMENRPPWGHGRIDPFNPVKFGMLGMHPAQDDTVGNSDMMPLWDVSRRRASDGSAYLHWDGLSTNLKEIALAGALGDGATRSSLPVRRLTDMVDWLQGPYAPRPPDYPFLAQRAAADVAKGESLYKQHCAACHDEHGSRANQIIPLSEIGTDPNRLRMWNPPEPLRDPPHPAERYNAFGDGYPWDLNAFVKTTGYVAPPLNGIWLRAPYLHNGSVPTLRDLLNPPMPEPEVARLVNDLRERQGHGASFEELRDTLSQGEPALSPQQLRPRVEELKRVVETLLRHARPAPADLAAKKEAAKKDASDKDPVGKANPREGTAGEWRPPLFYRGYDVLDAERVGFIHNSQATAGRSLPLPFATFVRGNGNQGHEYGTKLSPQEKDALVEYLKGL